MTEENIRCFIALDLPREAINELEEIQNLIRKKNLFYGKLTEPENLHLTLKFLGEINENKLKEIQEKLKTVKIKAFDASLGELGFFSKKSFRIMWIKLNGSELWNLQKEIDKICSELGFVIEERFMGHITLARIKKVTNMEEFLKYVKNLKHRKIKFQVKEFFLKKSELFPDGPVYNNLEKYSLE